jgi:hypothetical protein
MSSQDPERVRRLRDQQLRARDPLSKQRRLDGEISQKRKRMQQSFSFGGMWKDIPHRWTSGFIGCLIGLAILLIAPSVLEGSWGICLGGAAVPFAAVVGFMIGRYEDTMEEIKKDLH